MDDERATGRQQILSALLPLLFGLALLAFLVGIDRQDWFHLRPASGTAKAMSFAADRPLAED